jgi:hypothetical protein
LAYEVPLEYRLGRATRILMSTIGYLFTGGGIALITASLVVRNSGDFPTGMLFAGAVFLLLGAYALASVARVRVILHPDAIDVRRTFTTKRGAARSISAGDDHGVEYLVVLEHHHEVRVEPLGDRRIADGAALVGRRTEPLFDGAHGRAALRGFDPGGFDGDLAVNCQGFSESGHCGAKRQSDHCHL